LGKKNALERREELFIDALPGKVEKTSTFRGTKGDHKGAK